MAFLPATFATDRHGRSFPRRWRQRILVLVNVYHRHIDVVAATRTAEVREAEAARALDEDVHVDFRSRGKGTVEEILRVIVVRPLEQF